MAIVLVLSVAVSPVHAADELGLSSDGQTWSVDLAGPLFDQAIRWVPGDERQAEFYVRNQADAGGTLMVAVEAQDPDHLLRQEDMQLSARVGSEPWVELAPIGQAFRLDAAALPAGAVRKVEVKAGFNPASGNRSQRLAASFRFKVTLSGIDPTQVAEQPDEAQNPYTDLPKTGAPALAWFILVGGTAIGIGFALRKLAIAEEVSHGTPR